LRDKVPRAKRWELSIIASELCHRGSLAWDLCSPDDGHHPLPRLLADALVDALG
jgi:hypothetical protein